MYARTKFAKVTLDLKRNFKTDPENRPKSNDLYYYIEEDFLPEGKKWEDLTEKELNLIKIKYQYSPLYPGNYQTIGKKVSGGARGKSTYKRF